MCLCTMRAREQTISPPRGLRSGSSWRKLLTPNWPREEGEETRARAVPSSSRALIALPSESIRVEQDSKLICRSGKIATADNKEVIATDFFGRTIVKPVLAEQETLGGGEQGCISHDEQLMCQMSLANSQECHSERSTSSTKGLLVQFERLSR